MSKNSNRNINTATTTDPMLAFLQANREILPEKDRHLASITFPLIEEAESVLTFFTRKPNGDLERNEVAALTRGYRLDAYRTRETAAEGGVTTRVVLTTLGQAYGFDPKKNELVPVIFDRENQKITVAEEETLSDLGQLSLQRGFRSSSETKPEKAIFKFLLVNGGGYGRKAQGRSSFDIDWNQVGSGLESVFIDTIKNGLLLDEHGNVLTEKIQSLFGEYADAKMKALEMLPKELRAALHTIANAVPMDAPLRAAVAKASGSTPGSGTASRAASVKERLAELKAKRSAPSDGAKGED